MSNDDFIKSLYLENHKKIAKFIKSQIYSDSFADVEDCVQETFLIVVKKIEDDSMPRGCITMKNCEQPLSHIKLKENC